MAKFYGSVGYAETIQTAPGVHEEQIVEYPYYGDLTRNARQLQSGESFNDDINVANEISIVADPFARENFHKMRYVTFMGAKWKISRVEVGYTEFGSKPAEQSGHYLALKFDVTPTDAVTTVELVGGTKGPVTLGADKNIVLLIKNNTQSVKVTSTKDGSSVTKTYALTNLTLES